MHSFEHFRRPFKDAFSKNQLRQLSLITLGISLAVLTVSCSDKSAKDNRKGRTSNEARQDVPVAIAPVQSKERVEIPYPKDGVTLRNGWNSILGRKSAGECIVGDEHHDKDQTKSAFIQNVTDTSSLMQMLNISVSLQLQAIGGKVSGKAEFARELNVKDSNVNFVLEANVKNGPDYVVAPQSGTIDLRKDILDLDLPSFISRCGDSYVDTIHTGAELAALYTFEAHESEEKTRLHTEISGSGWGIEGKAALTQATKSYSANSKLKIVYHEAGGREDPIPTNQDEMVARIKDLPRAASKAATPFSIVIVRYDSLPSWRKSRTGWIAAKGGEIADQYGKLRSLYDQVVAFRKAPTDAILGYGVAVGDLQNLENRLHDHLVNLTNSADACVNSGGKSCNMNKADQVDEYQYRALLPAVHGSFGDDLELQSLPGRIKQVTDLMNQRREYHRSIYRAIAALGRLKGSGEEQFVNDACGKDPEYQQYASQLAGSQKSLAEVKARYPVSLKAAIVKQWIEIPSDFRCDRDIRDRGCLKPEQRQSWSDRVKIVSPQ